MLNVNALNPARQRLDEVSFESLLTLLNKGHVWALNLGETELTPDQLRRLLAVDRTSAVAFLFLEPPAAAASASQERGATQSTHRRQGTG